MKFNWQWLVTGSVTILCACSTVPQKKAPDISGPREVQIEHPAPTESAEKFLRLAKDAEPDRRNLLLFRAAEIWQVQQQCDKSIKVIDILRPELIVPMDISQAKLIEAECLLDMGFVPQSQKLANDIIGQYGLQQRLYTLRARLLEQQLHWLDAAIAWQKVASTNPQANEHIWPLLKKLSLKQLEQASQQNNDLQAWLQLAIITRKHSADAYRMAFELQTWQARYPNHPAYQNLPKDLDIALHTVKYQPQSIAVLLPLSGRLQSQGEALKQGILAAYFEHENAQPELTFIDSNLMQPQDSVSIAEQYDFIVGPLEKEKIESLLSTLPADKPVLALNRVANIPPQSQTYFFALAPEDEAQQLVEHLLDQGFKKPVLIASGNSSMQRMVSTFSQLWLEKTRFSPNSVTFESSKSMRTGIADLLEVNQSRARISQIERLYAKEVYSFYRNRQDIDAIVIFANAEETELLVPIIEASISPFSDMIPVFGSSRSYNQVMSNNSLRDLRNLTFIDMPWMLPQHPWQELKHSFDTLWPNHQGSLQRLFAMGYDAYTLIPHLKHMAILPELRVSGLTGQISLDSHDVLHQEFALGKVEQEQVIKIELD
ncbi:penicillin-binding protein activator [Neptunicella sp. SCSIO 80796]|uniref:penicillin-binding protein activator n=1 Tax=Neptunicella plasticusilytica TaxID=3117012 RepID=UPI003A4D9CA0